MGNITVITKNQNNGPVEKFDRNLLGKRIKEERVRVGMTREEMASCAGVSVAYIGFIERGGRSVTLEKLVPIAKCLGVTLDSLLREDPLTSGPAGDTGSR